MKVLLVASALALLPLAASAQLTHEDPPRQSAQRFPLELTALGLGAVGGVDASGENCVEVRAQGEARVLRGRAELLEDERSGPGRLLLEALAPGRGAEQVVGRAPLVMELHAFELRRDASALVGVHLPEGALAAAAGKRVTLSLWLEHQGAPLLFGVTPCEDTPGSSG